MIAGRSEHQSRPGDGGSDPSTASKQVLRISFTRLMQRAAELQATRGGRPVGVEGRHRDSALVPIRTVTGTSSPVLVLIHPVGGAVTAYFRLARFLDDEQPVYAIENQVAINPRARSFESIEAMAAAYLELIGRHRLAPPYVFAGYSMGGMVAFEMGRQAIAAGTHVTLVAIIDTPAAVAPAPEGADESMTAHDVVTMGTIIAGPLGIDLELDESALEAATPDERMDQIIHVLRSRLVLPPGIDSALFRRLVGAIGSNDRAQRRYRPQRFAGDVALFRAEERSEVLAGEAGPVYDEPAFGWQRFCARPVQVTTVQGGHLHLMEEPYVRALGARLQHAIDQRITTADPGCVS